MAADGDIFDAATAAQVAAFAVLDRRLDPASPTPVVVALSGGGDSLALLVLALAWARKIGRRVLALTVDHGLDPQSGRWTVETGRVARALGAQWRPLAWKGVKPTAGLPAAARRVRHALLADAARSAGGSVLLFGHTADDVAESELIRRDTPSHGQLRDWAPSPVWPEGRGIFSLRPLLRVRRQALRGLLAARGLSWIEDPANLETRFARTRARLALASGLDDLPPERSGEGWDPGSGGLGAERGSGLPLRGRLEPAKDRRDPDVGTELAVSTAGVISLPPGPLDTDLVRAAVACAAGRETSPSGLGLQRLAGHASRGTGWSVTLGGARILAADRDVIVCRELGREPPGSVPLSLGAPTMFDGRFELVADAPGWRVAPLAGHAAQLPEADRRRLAEVPAAARPTLPVLLHDRDAPGLPRPFGRGPAQACERVSARLAAAIGRIDSERDLAQSCR